MQNRKCKNKKPKENKTVLGLDREAVKFTAIMWAILGAGFAIFGAILYCFDRAWWLAGSLLMFGFITVYMYDLDLAFRGELGNDDDK